MENAASLLPSLLQRLQLQSSSGLTPPRPALQAAGALRQLLGCSFPIVLLWKEQLIVEQQTLGWIYTTLIRSHTRSIMGGSSREMFSLFFYGLYKQAWKVSKKPAPGAQFCSLSVYSALIRASWLAEEEFLLLVSPSFLHPSSGLQLPLLHPAPPRITGYFGLERTLQPISFHLLFYAGTYSTRSGQPCPTCPWTLPGMSMRKTMVASDFSHISSPGSSW